MKVIYNPNSKKIYRVIEDGATYTSDFPFEVTQVEAFSNSTLIAELKLNPQLLTYDSATNTFTKGEQTWVPNKHFTDDSQADFISTLPSLDQIISIINGAQTIDEVKQIMVMIVRGCYALANKVIN